MGFFGSLILSLFVFAVNVFQLQAETYSPDEDFDNWKLVLLSPAENPRQHFYGTRLLFGNSDSFYILKQGNRPFEISVEKWQKSLAVTLGNSWRQEIQDALLLDWKDVSRSEVFLFFRAFEVENHEARILYEDLKEALEELTSDDANGPRIVRSPLTIEEIFKSYASTELKSPSINQFLFVSGRKPVRETDEPFQPPLREMLSVVEQKQDRYTLPIISEMEESFRNSSGDPTKCSERLKQIEGEKPNN